MNEYIFENFINSNIRIIVKAISLEDAYEILNRECKNPSDYKLLLIIE